MPSKTSQDGYAAPAVIRAFELMRLLTDTPRPLSLTELSKKLGCGKSSIHGLLKALIQVNALNRVGKTYVMGPAMAELSLRGWNIFKLVEKAQPALTRLRNATGETVFLGVTGTSKSTIIATRDALKPLKISAPPGTEIPLQAGAVGKAFLSAMSRDSVDHFIETHGLPQFTPNSITEIDAYHRELETVRTSGYAMDNEEYLTGVKAVAVSINNRRGLPLAVWIAGFASSMDTVLTPETLTLITTTASELRAIVDNHN
ncbi:MAG: IclR family transcriptional regulator [Pseudomonadota bacterium]